MLPEHSPDLPGARARAGTSLEADAAVSDRKGAAAGLLPASAPRALAGEPCPNGCTEGHGREKRPELIVRSNPDPAHPDYGELSCPACWDYMGYDQRPAGRSPEREAG